MAPNTTLWPILGAGSMGCLLACMTPQPASFLLRPGQSAPNHIIYTNGQREHQVTLGSLPDRHPPLSHLILACKTYDTQAALEPWLPIIAPDCQILCLQNGMGHEERILPLLPKAQILYASMTHGAYRLAPFSVFHAGQGQLLFGNGHPTPSTPWQQLCSEQWAIHWRADIHTLLWHKLAVNAVINPLTALSGETNGQLLQQPRLQAWLLPLCREIESVLITLGIPLPQQGLQQLVEQVAQATSANRSSMLQDRQAKRRTEVDAILGHLLRQGQLHGLQLPTCSWLAQQLQILPAGKFLTPWPLPPG